MQGWCFDKSENDNLFAGDGADVMVQADNREAGDFRNQRYQDGARRLDQLFSQLFEQISACGFLRCLEQVPFGSI
jgi:hypothetical protein